MAKNTTMASNIERRTFGVTVMAETTALRAATGPIRGFGLGGSCRSIPTTGLTVPAMLISMAMTATVAKAAAKGG